MGYYTFNAGGNITSIAPQFQRELALPYIEELNAEFQQSEKKFSFDWVGELEDDEPSLSTVEIQHKIHTLKA